MAGASTYEQEVLLPGPWGRDHKIYAMSAREKGREKGRGKDERVRCDEDEGRQKEIYERERVR